MLSNRSGRSDDDIVDTFTVDLWSETLDGTRTLRANDHAAQDTGILDRWSVTF